MSKVTDTPHHGEVIPRGYSIVPHDVARDPSLSPIARLLYVLIDGHVGNKDGFQIKQETLAKELGVSVRTVRRYLKELEQAGWIHTRHTWRTALTRVENPAREAPKRTPVSAPKRTPVSASYRSNLERNKTTTARPTIKTEHTVQSAPVVAEYLQMIKERTGVTIGLNSTVHKHITAIAGQGITPETSALEIDAYLSTHKATITNPAGFIVSVILPALAAGETEWNATKTPRAPAHPDECIHGSLKVYGCDKCREINQRKAQECRAAV